MQCCGFLCLGASFFFGRSCGFVLGRPRLVKTAVIYAFITLAVSSPWLIKNAIWFHNPVYPFITGEVVDLNNGPRYFNREDDRKLDAHFDAARKAYPEEFQNLKTKFDEAVE